MVSGINRRVRYAMRESDGHFAIDPVSGIVSLTRKLDREQQAQFNLTLYAHDQVRGQARQGAAYTHPFSSHDYYFFFYLFCFSLFFCLQASLPVLHISLLSHLKYNHL